MHHGTYYHHWRHRREWANHRQHFEYRQRAQVPKRENQGRRCNNSGTHCRAQSRQGCAELHSTAAQSSDEEFLNQFNVTKDNVELALGDLEAHVVNLVHNVENPNVTFMMRARCVWNEDLMRKQRIRLHDALFLLQVLIQAAHW